jgi:hypothetical protein
LGWVLVEESTETKLELKERQKAEVLVQLKL